MTISSPSSLLSFGRRFVREVLTCLATVVWWKTQQKLDRSPFYSVIVDGSTDIANMTQLVILCRIVLPEQSAVEILFASIEELPFGEDASAVVAAITLALKRDNRDIDRFPCFASDGASVMCGHVDGAAGRLLHRNRFMICHHCVCHRECLGCKAAAEELHYICDVFPLTLKGFLVTSITLPSALQNTSSIVRS